jgi:hypothetical protein
MTRNNACKRICRCVCQPVTAEFFILLRALPAWLQLARAERQRIAEHAMGSALQQAPRSRSVSGISMRKPSAACVPTSYCAKRVICFSGIV